MKARIKSYELITERDLDGLSTVEVRCFKRVHKCITNGIIMPPIVLYVACYLPAGEYRYYDTYAELKKALGVV